MNIIDIISFLVIAISYNIFVHQVVTSLYRSYSYEEKIDYGIAFIFLAGFVGIILSKLLLKEEDTYSTSVVSMGLLVGGGLLIGTAILINWENISDDVRLFLTTILFISLVCYFYKRNKKLIK